jgi:hypothetical protein
MRQSLVSTIAFCLLCSFWGCEKDSSPTIINGTVMDSKTRKLISGASVNVGTKLGDDDYRFTDYITGADGKFTHTIYNGTYANDQISKGGYITKKNRFGKIASEQVNNIEILMIPRDGIFKLSVTNETGQNDTLYARIFPQIEKVESTGFFNGKNLSKYPLILKKGEVYNEVFFLASTDNVDVEWGRKPGVLQQQWPNKITLVLKDTLNYTLKY